MLTSVHVDILCSQRHDLSMHHANGVLPVLCRPLAPADHAFGALQKHCQFALDAQCCWAINIGELDHNPAPRNGAHEMMWHGHRGGVISAALRILNQELRGLKQDHQSAGVTICSHAVLGPPTMVSRKQLLVDRNVDR